MQVPGRLTKQGISRSGSGSDAGLSMPALDPLLDLDWDEIPDVPSDVRPHHLIRSPRTDRKDLLQSLQSYSSRYYTANNLLLEPYKRVRNQRQSASHTRSISRTNTPMRDIERVQDEESGSEYGSERTSAAINNDKEGVGRNGDGDGRDLESELGVEGLRKRGGQRGKRKLKDMHLALDGSALLTLGMSSLLYVSLS